MQNNITSVSVVGLGYMGLPTALLLAEAGLKVHGYDIDAAKVKKLNDGISTCDEKGIPELLKKNLLSGHFQASTELKASEVFIIAVPTPHHNKKCDLTYVIKACETVAKIAANNSQIIIESTIKPGTCRDVVAPIFSKTGKHVDVFHCPERALPGDTLHELIHNDRIIGGTNPDSLKKIELLYKTFVKGGIYLTDITTAEAVKLMENTFRDVNIALANEFSLVAEELQFNVWEAIALANRHPRVNILQPGPGVGGHCIAIDPWFLTEDTKFAKLITSAREINDDMPSHVVRRLFEKHKLQANAKIVILGAAYKKNIDDSRESPAEHIYHFLQKKGHAVKVHDPLVEYSEFPIEKDLERLKEWADAFILVTDHDAYKTFSTKKPLLDTRNFLKE